MIKFAQIDAHSGEVVNIVNLQSAHGYTDGAIVDGLLFKRLEPGTNETTFAQTQYWRNDQWNTREVAPSVHHIWVDYDWVIDTTGFWDGVRYQRDIYLAMCDWTQLPDCALSAEDKSVWQTYRQELRDITTTQSVVENPSDFVWPTKPSV